MPSEPTWKRYARTAVLWILLAVVVWAVYERAREIRTRADTNVGEVEANVVAPVEPMMELPDTCGIAFDEVHCWHKPEVENE